MGRKCFLDDSNWEKSQVSVSAIVVLKVDQEIRKMKSKTDRKSLYFILLTINIHQSPKQQLYSM